MFNYIRAECYKLLRRKYTYVALAVMLALETLFVSMFAFHNSHSFETPFSAAVIMIVELGSIGFCACLITGDIVFGGQYKNSTLKNEVSFGLSRTRIYLGKLIAQTLLSIMYMLIMVGFFVGACAVALPHGIGGFPSDTDALIIVGYFLAVGLPLWIGGQAVACMCQFLFQGEMTSSFAYVGIIFVLNTVVEIAGLLIEGNVGEFLLKSCSYFPLPMLGAANSLVGDWNYLGKACGVGLFWLVVSTAAGMYGFNRKEIK